MRPPGCLSAALEAVGVSARSSLLESRPHPRNPPREPRGKARPAGPEAHEQRDDECLARVGPGPLRSSRSLTDPHSPGDSASWSAHVPPPGPEQVRCWRAGPPQGPRRGRAERVGRGVLGFPVKQTQQRGCTAVCVGGEFFDNPALPTLLEHVPPPTVANARTGALVSGEPVGWHGTTYIPLGI
jgi:hypothetical protein